MDMMKEIGAVVVIIFMIAFALLILNHIQNQTPKNSLAYNATVDAEKGLLTFAFWLEPIHFIELTGIIISSILLILIWYISKSQ